MLTTPRPYPIAALMPVTNPWNNAARGSSDGVNDRHANSNAAHEPGSVYVSRRRHRLGADDVASHSTASSLGVMTSDGVVILAPSRAELRLLAQYPPDIGCEVTQFG